jgi:hypothetical protein
MVPMYCCLPRLQKISLVRARSGVVACPVVGTLIPPEDVGNRLYPSKIFSYGLTLAEILMKLYWVIVEVSTL